MTTALTTDLGTFVSELQFREIPEEALSSIRMAFTDCLGAAIAGAPEPAPQLLKKMVAPTGTEATLLVGGGRASAMDAAWINGTAAHALDFDDVAQQGGHTSAVMVPAILAEAEVLGASGEQMVRAYAAGYETIAELAQRAHHWHEKGWHATAVYGSVGAAAACAALRGLDARKAATAIALGASQSAGLDSNFGTMAKPFHAGRAAQAGVAAARLADLGFTAMLDALEHPPGFLVAISLDSKVDIDTPIKAGKSWQICGGNRISIKKYPVCYCAHRAIDGMLDLLKARPVKSEEVERITVTLSPRNAAILRNHAPQTDLEAKFSIEFALASPLVAGRAGLSELTDGFVRRSDVQALMKRVVIMTDDREDPTRAGFASHDRVVIETRGGQRLDSGPITQVRGDQDSPLARDELWAKFQDCVRAGNAGIPAEPLFDMLMTLDKVPHVRSILERLTATGPEGVKMRRQAGSQ